MSGVVHRKVHKVNAKIRSKDPSSCQESFTAKFTKLIAKIRIKELRPTIVVTSSCARLAISSHVSAACFYVKACHAPVPFCNKEAK